MRTLAAVLVLCIAAMAADVPAIDAIFAPLANAKSPGVALLVRKDGKTVFARGYGVRELRTFAPIDAKTDFRLASFTKQFTAMAILLLVHDGVLSYDKRLTDVFPDFPDWARAITIRHLLTHTGGLPDYESAMEGGPWTETRQIQDDEVLALLKRQSKPKFAAGTSWAYSNSGYVVLGTIVAKASGMPYGAFLKRRIFDPLHMTNTLVYVKGKNEVPNRAFGHSKKGDGFQETDQSSTSATQGDGGIYSNLEDLAKWDEALDKHTLLSEGEIRPAFTPVKLANGAPTYWPKEPDDDNLHPGKPVLYGFGWFLDPFEGRPRMWHSGSTRGFSTVIQRYPDEKLSVVVLCNRTDLSATALAEKAVKVLAPGRM